MGETFQSSKIYIQPMQWAALHDLGDTPPLDASDLACMDEVRAVLAAHGKLRRFALHLAHRHFDLAPGEVLIERPDPDNRTQHVAPGRLDDAAGGVPTTWLFDDRPELHAAHTMTYCVCVPSPLSGDACARHGKSADPGKVVQENEAIRDRRIEREKNRSGPVAGHDWERERER